MITLSPAAEARETLRARLHQIAVHSAVDYVRMAAGRALQELTETSALYVIQLSVQCSYRTKLIIDFTACRTAGGFNANA